MKSEDNPVKLITLTEKNFHMTPITNFGSRV